MSDGTFTMEDAENDGKIKREAGPEMAKVASREFGELFEMFSQVCKDRGLEPKTVLADGVLKAIKDESFAERISQVEINMRELKKGSIRKEDAKMLQNFAEELGINDDGGSDDWLEETVKERIQSKTQSPMSQLTEASSRREGGDSGELARELNRLTSKIDEIERKVEESETSTTETEDKQDTDELFDGLTSEGDSSDSESDVEEGGEQDTEEDTEVNISLDDATTGTGDEDEEEREADSIVSSEDGGNDE